MAVAKLTSIPKLPGHLLYSPNFIYCLIEVHDDVTSQILSLFL